MASTSMPVDEFLVYILRRSDLRDPYDNTKDAPFYVGKGRRNRPGMHRWEAYATTKNTRKLNIIRAVERGGGHISSEIVVMAAPEAVAFMIEKQLIAFYGRDDMDGILANRTDGGEGCTGMSEEGRRRISAAKLGKPHSPETIKKLQIARIGFHHTEATKIKIGNISRGVKRTEETRARMRIAQAIAVPLKRPPTYTPETRAHRSALMTGRKYPEAGLKRSGKGNGVARAVVIDGQAYDTLRDAAKAIGIHQDTLHARIQRNAPGHAYVVGTEHLAAKLSGGQNQNAKAVRINGILYQTVNEAMTALGIGKSTFYRRLKRGFYVLEDISITEEE